LGGFDIMAIGRSGSRALARVAATAVLSSALGISGCGSEQDHEGDEARGEEDVQGAAIALDDALAEGQRLFDEETFNGNGRTCLTCHSTSTGTLNPEQVQQVFAANPQDPLFLFDGSDDGQGNGTERIRKDATIRVRLRFPSNVSLAGDPTARSVTVRRAIAATLNTPKLDPVIMSDGRAPSLQNQAIGAVRGHAQAPNSPTQEQLDLIAAFETTDSRFFSSKALRSYALGNGPAPQLPKGHSKAQKRGKKWFETAEIADSINQDTPRTGLCATCHSGPMLNEPNASLAKLAVPASALGSRFQSVLVSELNHAQNTAFTFVVQNTDGTTFTGTTPDPGRAMIENKWEMSPLGLGVHSAFKVPSLWAVKKTAPYFHDNSAATLQAVVEHYAEFFMLMTAPAVDGDPSLIMTSQDKADLVAYLKLL
jgi:cytochrome c peroxidase